MLSSQRLQAFHERIGDLELLVCGSVGKSRFRVVQRFFDLLDGLDDLLAFVDQIVLFAIAESASAWSRIHVNCRSYVETCRKWL